MDIRLLNQPQRGAVKANEDLRRRAEAEAFLLTDKERINPSSSLAMTGFLKRVPRIRGRG